MEELSAYEEERLRRIAENKRKLIELGIETDAEQQRRERRAKLSQISPGSKKKAEPPPLTDDQRAALAGASQWIERFEVWLRDDVSQANADKTMERVRELVSGQGVRLKGFGLAFAGRTISIFDDLVDLKAESAAQFGPKGNGCDHGGWHLNHPIGKLLKVPQLSWYRSLGLWIFLALLSCCYAVLPKPLLANPVARAALPCAPWHPPLTAPQFQQHLLALPAAGGVAAGLAGASSSSAASGASTAPAGGVWLVEGASVEVEMCEDGFWESFYEATLVSVDEARESALVRYTHLMVSDGGEEQLVETVKVSALRPPPPRVVGFAGKLRRGAACEVFHEDGWWAVRVFDRHKGKGMASDTFEVASESYAQIDFKVPASRLRPKFVLVGATGEWLALGAVSATGHLVPYVQVLDGDRRRHVSQLVLACEDAIGRV